MKQYRRASGASYPGPKWLALVVGCALFIVGSPAFAQTPSAAEAVDPEVEETVEMEDIRERESPEFEGQPVVHYDLRCDLELCQSPEIVERFKEMSGLSVGDTYRTALIERAQRRLAMTGFFQELEVERRLEADGVHVEISAQGAVLIRRIEFDGLSPPPFQSELRNVLMYRSGQLFQDDADMAAAQLRSLEAMFEQEGYFGTRITLRAEPVDDEPHLVDLVFDIERGPDRRICSLAFRGVRGMTVAEARELMLSGVSLIARRIPLRLPMYTSEQFRSGREALIGEYRRRGYFRARIVDQAVQIDDATNCVQLIVDVSEGPYWDVQFEGNDSVDAERLREALPFAESGYVDAEEIRMAENAVRQIYEAQGFPYTQVSGEEVVEDRLDRRLVFYIQEGPHAQIDELRFHGLQAFSEREASEGFGTQTFGLFDTGGYLLTEQLLNDFSRLERRYREAGYLQAVVESFTVELNEDGDGITIDINVDEGEQSRVEGVYIQGYKALSKEEIGSILSVAPGDVFVPLSVQADHARLTQHYGSIGYPQVQIETICRDGSGERVPCEAPRFPEGCEYSTFDALVEQGCQWQEIDGRPTVTCERFARDEECELENGVIDESVTVHHDIREGGRVRVGEILLKGNFRTRSRVIFRELPLESGDLLNVEKLLEGQGNMRSLGIFNSVSIETIGLHDDEDFEELEELAAVDNPANPDEPDDQVASLIVSVEESRARFIDFRFGFEGRELLDDSRRLLATGELQYTDQNLFGAGQRFMPRIIGATDTLEVFRLGADATREIDAATDVRDLDSLFGAELIYSHPRFLRGQFGINELFLTVTPFYLVDYLGVSTDQVLREEWGLRLELRKELYELMDRLYLTFGGEGKQAATWATGDLRVDGERIFSPRRATGKLIPELTLDRRDSPLNPREGFHVQLQPELVSGDALAQSGEEFVRDSYFRLTFAASLFWGLTDDLILGQGVTAGQIVPVFDRQRLVPLDERYYLGGIGSVRGFSANTLGPVGGEQQPIGGEFLLNYNAELRYPLLGDWGMYGATFFDAGLLVNCTDQGERSSRQCYSNAFPEDDRLSQIRATAGLGLRYLLVGQIPLLLDYGMVLNRRPGESFGSLHFNLGYTF